MTQLQGNHPSSPSIENALTGFTLVEVLITMGILGILTSVVLVAINPAGQTADAKDVRRKSNARQMTKAMLVHALSVNQLAGEQAGVPLPPDELSSKPICKKGIPVVDCHGAGGISIDVISPAYIVVIPVDELEPPESLFTGYCIYKIGADPRVIPGYCGTTACPSVCTPSVYIPSSSSSSSDSSSSDASSSDSAGSSSDEGSSGAMSSSSRPSSSSSRASSSSSRASSSSSRASSSSSRSSSRSSSSSRMSSSSIQAASSSDEAASSSDQTSS